MSINETIDESKKSNEVDTLLDEKVKNGKNNNIIKCKYCSSKILNPQMGTYLTQEFPLPLMTRKSKSDEEKEYQSETEKHFWSVNSIYTFENMGFSKTVKNIKYLVCADCESGPLGYFNVDTNISYLAFERVKYVE